MNTNIGQIEETTFTEPFFALEDETNTIIMNYFKKIVAQNLKIKKQSFDLEQYVEGICQYLIRHFYDLFYTFDKNFSILFEVKDQIIKSKKLLVKNTLLLEILALFDLKLYKKHKRLLGFRIFKDLKVKLQEQGLNITQKSQNSNEYYFVFNNTLKRIIKSSNTEYYDPILNNYYSDLFAAFVDGLDIAIPDRYLEIAFEYNVLKFSKPFIESLFIDEAIANYNEILCSNSGRGQKHTYYLFKNRTEIILHGLKEWIMDGNTFDIKTPLNIAPSLISLVERKLDHHFVKKSLLYDHSWSSSGIYTFLNKNEELLNKIIDTVISSEHDKISDLKRKISRNQTTLSEYSQRLRDVKRKIITQVQSWNQSKIDNDSDVGDVLRNLEEIKLVILRKIKKAHEEIDQLKEQKEEIINSFQNLSKNSKESSSVKAIIKELNKTNEMDQN